jgi:hypothetical protein
MMIARPPPKNMGTMRGLVPLTYVYFEEDPRRRGLVDRLSGVDASSGADDCAGFVGGL